MNAPQIEPGLLKVFRLYNTILWLLLLLAACGSLDERGRMDPLVGVLLLQTTALVFFLAWPRLRRWFGRVYLPLALIAVSVAPSIGYALGITARVADGLTGQEAVGEAGALLLLLIVPLLLWSSQYGVRAMVTFIAGVALVDMTFAVLIAASGGPATTYLRDQVVVRTFMFVVVGFVVARLSSAQREQRRTLAEKNAQLTHYASTLEQLATSRERNRMARELHDTLAHSLSAMTVQLGALEVLLETDPAAGHALLSGVRDMSRDGLHELRRALHALRASPLEDLGFALAVRQLAEAAADRAGLRLELAIPEQIADMAPDVEQHLFRIAEEAVTNAVRHANASTLTIAVQRKRGRFGLLVNDDGIGFDPDAQNGHRPGVNGRYGLVGMRERALLCNADLRIISRPSRGTSIQVWIEEGSS